MDLEDVARQRLVAGGHTANRPGSEHAVVARGEKPAVQRLSEDPAYRRDPETASVLVNVRGHQRRVGSSRAAKKPRPSSESRSPSSIARPRPEDS